MSSEDKGFSDEYDKARKAYGKMSFTEQLREMDTSAESNAYLSYIESIRSPEVAKHLDDFGQWFMGTHEEIPEQSITHHKEVWEQYASATRIGTAEFQLEYPTEMLSEGKEVTLELGDISEALERALPLAVPENDNEVQRKLSVLASEEFNMKMETESNLVMQEYAERVQVLAQLLLPENRHRHSSGESVWYMIDSEGLSFYADSQSEGSLIKAYSFYEPFLIYDIESRIGQLIGEI